MFSFLGWTNKENQIVEYERSSYYDSAFTYNTERQFCNEYSSIIYNNAENVDDNYTQSLQTKIIEKIFMILSLLFAVCTLPISLLFSVKFVSSFERMIIMRLGRCYRVENPGIVFVLPFIDKAISIDTRIISSELPTFYIITTDRGLVELTIVVFSKIIDPLSAYFNVQNRDQTLQSLLYNKIYNILVKKMLCDITDPQSVERILENAQREFNIFCQNMGTEITEVKVTKLKQIKQGQNQALSLFNTLIKSDLGTQFFNHFGPHIKDYLKEAIKNSNNNSNELFSQLKNNKDETLIENNIPKEKPLINLKNNVNERDTELEHIIEKIRKCCDRELVNKVCKYYRIKCVNFDGSIIGEFDINLKDENGSCNWYNPNSSCSTPDVVFTLQKQTLFSLITNTISPLTAYLNGLVTINGTIADALLLKHLGDKAKLI